MSILVFLLVLIVIVFVHELGHFAVAKWTGMRVDEFGIGFPPKLFGIKRGETLYTLNALPIGGFVKIAGEDAIGSGKSVEDSRYFTSKSKWAQSAVLLAGITMNILFAWLLVAVSFGLGVQKSVSESEAGPQAKLTITSVLPESPASKIALLPGSIIKGVSAGDATLETLNPSSFSTFIAEHGDTPVTIAYTYKGELRATVVSPEKGIIANNLEKPAIGVALAQVDIVKHSFLDSITDSFIFVVEGLRDITLGLGKLVSDAVRMQADFSQLAGPVGIVGMVGEASAFGLTSLLMFSAFISLNLAVINVLPFPALDGGRLLFVIIEAIKGKPITPAYVATLNTVGFFILIALMVVVTWNDIARLI